MKICIDAFGGDNAPQEIIKGCVEALDRVKDFQLVIVGKQDAINAEIAKYKTDLSRVEVVDAADVITNEDTPTLAIREKKDSSLVKALRRVKEDDEVEGFVSAGSTGAVLTGALLIVGRLQGVDRPALAPVLPTIKRGYTLLVDCGANMDSKPEYLLQFAYMGAAYMKAALDIPNPRVALMNVGTEDKKGNELAKEAFALLKGAKLNFVGNMEARDSVSGEYDVLVCDGFVGNVALKSLEGASNLVMGALKQEVMSSFRAKIGAMIMKPAFRKLKHRLDYNRIGGAPFLGCKKVVVKAHGSSKADAFAAAVVQAYTMAKNKLPQSIEAALAQVGADKGNE